MFIALWIRLGFSELDWKLKLNAKGKERDIVTYSPHIMKEMPDA